jgi:hypothetical protein
VQLCRGERDCIGLFTALSLLGHTVVDVVMPKDRWWFARYIFDEDIVRCHVFDAKMLLRKISIVAVVKMITHAKDLRAMPVICQRRLLAIHLNAACRI